MPVLRRFLAHLKLTVNEDKTRVVSASTFSACTSGSSRHDAIEGAVRGWGNYFSRLNSSRHFWNVDGYVFYELRRWLRRKHQRLDRAFWSTPPTFLVKAGLHVLHGTVAYGR